MTWFFIALLAVIVIGVLSHSGQKECPYCRKRIDKRASVCPHCQKEQPEQNQINKAEDRWVQRFGKAPKEEETAKSSFEREKSKSIAWILISIVLAIAVGLFVAYIDKNPSHENTEKQFRTESALSGMSDINVHRTVNDLRAGGLVKQTNAQLDEVEVDYSVWRLLPFEQKKQAAMVLAEYIARQDYDKTPDVTIRDFMSGKKLASYSSVFGYKVKE